MAQLFTTLGPRSKDQLGSVAMKLAAARCGARIEYDHAGRGMDEETIVQLTHIDPFNAFAR